MQRNPDYERDIYGIRVEAVEEVQINGLRR